MTEEKFLEKVISEMECCLPRIFDSAGLPNCNGQFNSCVYWYYNADKHSFYLESINYAKKEVTLATITAPSDDDFLWMTDSLKEYMNFNIPKYFETYEFVVRGYKVTCKQTEQNTPLECTFFFKK